MINKPPRITENTHSLLDIIITNRSDFILHSNVIPCHVPDHDGIKYKENKVTTGDKKHFATLNTMNLNHSARLSCLTK